MQEGIAVVDVRGLELERDIFIGRSTNRPMTAAQAAFWDFARGEAQAQEVVERDPRPLEMV